MSVKRLFIAIDISDEARGRAAGHIDQLRATAGNVRVGWEKPEKLHVTLKFLGNVEEWQIPEIEGGVQTIANGQTVFSVDLAGSGVFPSVRKPRVLWISIGNDEGKVTDLGRTIESNLSSLGSPIERRDFSPHLTIARIREPQKGHELATLHIQKDFEPVRFEVSELVIYESHLEPTGSIYTVLNRFPFGN